MTEEPRFCAPGASDKYVIVLTGGIGSGKSAAASILEELGAGIVDTDLISRQVVEPGGALLRKIEKIWGREVLQTDGSLNRKALGRIVFASESQRERLNAIIHTPIREKMFLEIEESGENPVVVVIPLYYETKTPLSCREVWLVYCSEAQQIERLRSRENIDLDEAVLRIKSQIPIDEKLKMADIIIDNRGGPEDLRKNILEEWGKLCLRMRRE